MGKKSAVPEKVGEVLREIGLTPETAGWDCHGTYVLLHKALEKVAAKKGVVFDPPQIISANVTEKEAVVMVTGRMGDRSEWSIGEAAQYNNKNSYPFAMAEKRAKDRVILKLVGLHGDVYSEEEADAFKESRPDGMTATPAAEEKTDENAYAENLESALAKAQQDLDLVASGLKDLMPMHDSYEGLVSFWKENKKNLDRMKEEREELYEETLNAFKDRVEQIKGEDENG